MRIIFSRKGFDSAAGGGPSPIVQGRPVSLPIPGGERSQTRYADLGLGPLAEAASRGQIRSESLCHQDPMFEAGRCAFGQTGAAQTHLTNAGVGVGDVFLFFGLFSDGGRERHHRLFGYLAVEDVVTLGPEPCFGDQPRGFARRHPHTIGTWQANNTLYLGPGRVAARAPEALRLSRVGGPLSQWRVPDWLRETGLSYHRKAERWAGDTLSVVPRGQEFVADIGARKDALDWLETIMNEMTA